MDLVVNMDLRIVLLCLGVLSCVQSFQAEIVPPLTPRSFTAANGPLFNTDLGHYPGVIYPVNKWILHQWIYITSMNNPNADLIKMTFPNIYAYKSASYLYYSAGDMPTAISALGVVLSRWIYFATGMNGVGNAFLDYIIRGENPLHIASPSNPTLVTESVYQGSDDAYNFKVRG
jgi:hypothetical protein